jgi:hypothetical protein
MLAVRGYVCGGAYSCTCMSSGSVAELFSTL